MVPSIFCGHISHHLFATHNDLVQLANPKEGHRIEYCFFLGFRFISPFGISASTSSMSALLGYACISRTANFTLRTYCYLILGVEVVLAPSCLNTWPVSCTDINHFLIGTPGDTFYMQLRLLQRIVAYISKYLVAYLYVEPYK